MPDTFSGSQSLGTLRSNGWKNLPSQSGIYWWYFPPECVHSFRVTEYCDEQSLNLRMAADGKFCLYVGVAKSLKERMKWHAEQPLKQSALRSGFLSTFRKTLLVLNQIDYATGFDPINQFMDGLDVAWLTTGNIDEAKESEAVELTGDFHFPLNIQGNRHAVLKPFIQFLKQQRKSYVAQFLDKRGTPE